MVVLKVRLPLDEMWELADLEDAGDVSMTRQDAAIGDNRNFQVDLYDEVSH
jgi:hypothetical protein